MQDVKGSALFQGERITKRFGDCEALSGCGIAVRPGEIIAIIGPSGSGKSTLLRCLNLLEIPDSGSLFYEGRPVIEVASEAPLSRKSLTEARRQLAPHVGMVFQGFNLFPNYSALENISLALRVVKGLSKREAQVLALERLAQVNLGDKAKSFPAQLSGGQKQRVAIARAVAMEPQILLYDEPTSALDPELVGEVLSTIRELARKGMTKVIVTHELAFAREIADEVVFMEEGRVVETGKPADIFDNPKLERTRRFISRLDLERSDLNKDGNQHD